MNRIGHNPDGLSDPTASGMSQVAAATGRFVAISGQVALDATGEVVGGGDFEAQAVQVFENLAIALAAAGASFADVVRLGSYLTDISNLAILRDVRLRYLTEPYPAATAIEAPLALPEFLLEVDAIAIVSS